MMLRNLISHVCETRKFVMAILHWKQGLLCNNKMLLVATVYRQQIFETANIVTNIVHIVAPIITAVLRGKLINANNIMLKSLALSVYATMCVINEIRFLQRTKNSFGIRNIIDFDGKTACNQHRVSLTHWNFMDP